MRHDTSPAVTPDQLQRSIDALADRLVSQMCSAGYWEGELSSSALSTATALSALALADEPGDAARISQGVNWLAAHQNSDGGWGDTVDSPTNLATTLLSLSALRLAGAATDHGAAGAALCRAAAYLARYDGGTRRGLAAAIQAEYGEDRTFAVPILMNCGLAGVVDWDGIPGLPFELAVFPHRFYRLLRLQVVSYALPALIAIGLAIDQHHPPRSRLQRWLRRLATPRVLAKLETIQPDGGGYLEAAPLTSFVAMGLIPHYGSRQPVVARCLQFLRRAQRGDGSWPIDTNLAVWLTTGAVTALAAAGRLSRIDAPRTARWIAAQQQKTRHPYTQAAPGAWAWTHLHGGVVDADDTAGAILALGELGHCAGQAEGVRWLLDLQNADGGWPTFCRGWGKLPFDQSAADITAHALRAILRAESTPTPRSRRAIRRGLGYLRRTARPDGGWVPLWFGNQGTPRMENPVIGTARVLRALEIAEFAGPIAAAGANFLVSAQNDDGGWGGSPGTPSTQEETALAVAGLTPWAAEAATRRAVQRGVAWLCAAAVAERPPAPIGLYFAHLWYAEKLYPTIWTLEALGRVGRQFGSEER